jgi:hypothetical protein
MDMPPIPEGWTKDRDREWFKGRFQVDGEEARTAAVERLWHERTQMEDYLAECISTFVGAADLDPEPLAQSLASEAKVDLLSKMLQGGSPAPGNLAQCVRELHQMKAALRACDQLISRVLLQPEAVWLLELGTVAEELAFSGWQFKQSVRREYEYKPRSRPSPKGTS